MKQNDSYETFFSEYEILWLKRIQIVLIVATGLLLTFLLTWSTDARIVPIPYFFAAGINSTCEFLRKGTDEPFDSSKWKTNKATDIGETWHQRWRMCKSVQLMLPKMEKDTVISLLGKPDCVLGSDQVAEFKRNSVYVTQNPKLDDFFSYTLREGALYVHIRAGKVVESYYSPLMRE